MLSFRGRGYSVAFADENKDPPYYCGPVGDFRNEGQVADLVIESGFEKVQQLDIEASKWFELYGSYVKES
jgi:hypothetical protein